MGGMMLVDGSIKTWVFRTEIRFSIMMRYAVPIGSYPKFKIEYWLFKFGNMKNRIVYGKELIEQVRQITAGMDLSGWKI